MLHARAAQLREILVKTQNMYLVPSSWKHPLTKAPRLIGATDAVLLICLAIFFCFWHLKSGEEFYTLTAVHCHGRICFALRIFGDKHSGKKPRVLLVLIVLRLHIG